MTAQPERRCLICGHATHIGARGCSACNAQGKQCDDANYPEVSP